MAGLQAVLYARPIVKRRRDAAAGTGVATSTDPERARRIRVSD